MDFVEKILRNDDRLYPSFPQRKSRRGNGTETRSRARERRARGSGKSCAASPRLDFLFARQAPCSRMGFSELCRASGARSRDVPRAGTKQAADARQSGGSARIRVFDTRRGTRRGRVSASSANQSRSRGVPAARSLGEATRPKKPRARARGQRVPKTRGASERRHNLPAYPRFRYARDFRGNADFRARRRPTQARRRLSRRPSRSPAFRRPFRRAWRRSRRRVFPPAFPP